MPGAEQASGHAPAESLIRLTTKITAAPAQRRAPDGLLAWFPPVGSVSVAAISESKRQRRPGGTRTDGVAVAQAFGLLSPAA